MAKNTTISQLLSNALKIQRKSLGHNFCEISNAPNGYWMIQTTGYRYSYGRQAHGQTLHKAAEGFYEEWKEQ
jgi:hypothetical protein